MVSFACARSAAGCSAPATMAPAASWTVNLTLWPSSWFAVTAASRWTRGGIALHLRRDDQAGAAVIVQGEVGGVDAEQLNCPVQSAVEREIGHLGVNGVAIHCCRRR